MGSGHEQRCDKPDYVSLSHKAEAWDAIVTHLTRRTGGQDWLLGDGTGLQCAIATIDRLTTPLPETGSIEDVREKLRKSIEREQELERLLAESETERKRLRGVASQYYDQMCAAQSAARSATQPLKAEKDEAYRQRNVLVAALARMYPSGIRRTEITGWSDDWHGCCFIDLPSGQISYHYHDSQAHLFDGLPPYTKEWDGHDKKTVEDRLLTITAVSTSGRSE